MESLTSRLKAQALRLGFDKVGIARAEPLSEEARHLREWVARGFHASMGWMADALPRRTDPREILPGARSVVSLAMNYFSDTPHSEEPRNGKISRYAWGDDYHEILSSRAEKLCAWLAREVPGSASKLYVDTGPVMEKAWAARSGIGWLGKHTNIITTEYGSWVFLAEILTTAELETDSAAIDHCGSCTLCIQACPTDAIVEPYLVDSNLCLSYLTIEHRGAVEEGLRERFKGWIYGCDICQDVCPWNVKFARPSQERAFAPRPGNEAPDLQAWILMDQTQFSARFRKSPVKRAKWEGLLRNIRIVLGIADPPSSSDSSHR